jgi:hypothetical protein
VDGDYCRPHALKVEAGETAPARTAPEPPEALTEDEAEPAEAEPDEEHASTSQGRAVSDLRVALTQDATVDYEKIWDLIEAALSADRETFATCAKCHKRTPVMVADLSARVQAARCTGDPAPHRRGTTVASARRCISERPRRRP